MLEKYLKEISNNYKIYATFENYGNQHVVATLGIDSDYVILFQGGNQIFSSDGELLANVVNGEIEVV